MKLVKGANLTQSQREKVLSAFVHRHLAIGEGKYYKTEQDWILDHAFYFRKDGELPLKPKHCEPAFLGD